jgi:hypothetical protein
MKNLSPNFTDRELGVEGLSDRIVENATHLCVHVLEPIREYVAEPVIVNDGFRPPVHNAETGGVVSSEHLYNDDHAAADIRFKTQPLTAVFNWIRLKSGIYFRQVILEYGKDNVPACIHVSCRRNGNDKREALIGHTHGDGAYQKVECEMPNILHDDEGGTA